MLSMIAGKTHFRTKLNEQQVNTEIKSSAFMQNALIQPLKTRHV